MTFGEKAIAYFNRLTIDIDLPPGIVAMNPYQQPETMDAVAKFYSTYYNDNAPRTFIIGINPGRFGAGVTGIAFTDTVRLKNDCGIDHFISPSTELSSDYIYRVIRGMGGPRVFFSEYYLTAVSPIGFTKDSKNYNYYDSSTLLKAIIPYIKKQLSIQIDFGANRKDAFCLGAGKNIKILREVNELMGSPFQRITPINHPRYVMQYRRRTVDEEISYFIETIKRASSKIE